MVENNRHTRRNNETICQIKLDKSEDIKKCLNTIYIIDIFICNTIDAFRIDSCVAFSHFNFSEAGNKYMIFE